MKAPRPTLTGASLLLYAFLYAPIGVVVIYSFNRSRYGQRWEGFTLEWYQTLWRNEVALSAAANSLILAAASTLLATLLGTLLGYSLSRYQWPGQKLMLRFLHLPVFIPDIVLAVSLLLFFSLLRQSTGWFQLGLPTMVVAHVTFQIPFVTLIVRSRLCGLDSSLEEAAHDLGATAAQAFWHVTLPLLRPGIVAGSLLAFTLSLDDFVVSFFTSGPGSTTLPILIYSSVKRGITPDINALSTCLILASVVLTISLCLIQRRQSL